MIFVVEALCMFWRRNNRDSESWRLRPTREDLVDDLEDALCLMD